MAEDKTKRFKIILFQIQDMVRPGYSHVDGDFVRLSARQNIIKRASEYRDFANKNRKYKPHSEILNEAEMLLYDLRLTDKDVNKMWTEVMRKKSDKDNEFSRKAVVEEKKGFSWNNIKNLFKK